MEKGKKTFIKVERRGAVGRLTLDRSECANAYNQTMLDQLETAFRATSAEPKVKVILLTATGKCFCAGADLKELPDRTHADAFVLKSAQVFDLIARCPKITMAVLNGPAVGGGLELALACDLRIACPEMYVAMPEVSMGLIPAAGGTRRLPKLVGVARAKAVILGGARLHAQEALTCGLVSEVVERNALMKAALDWATRIAEHDALAMQLAKRAIDLEMETNAGQHTETLSQALLYELAHRSRLV